MASQSAEFWNQVGKTDADVEHVYGYLLERATPLSSRDLAINLVEWRVREEEKHLAELAARRSPVYQPKNAFEVGQSLVFTALGNREGTIREIRPGDNPRLGDFDVISVELEGEPDVREFAARYLAAHPLNEDITQTAISLGLTPEEAVEKYGSSVREALVQRLTNDKEFVHLGDRWFLKGLLPEIHPGYLNLAEAAIEQAGDALPTGELAKILDLPQTAKKGALDFALNLALGNDPRFEDVGPVDQRRWILVRMELPEARERPLVLDLFPARTVKLPAELEIIATDLFDTADSNGAATKPAQPPAEVPLILTYPHRHAGSLPLIPPLRALLPEFSHPRLKLNFVNAATQERVPGYAVADGNYLVGLAPWYNQHRLSPGALLTIRRGAEPLTLVVEFQPQRERSLWVRVARGVNGRLTFANDKRPVAHKSDPEMLIVIADPIGVDTISQAVRHDHSLVMLLEEIFPELAKLDRDGRVHAKTLFSAVNILRRVPPRAVMSALSESQAFTSVGGGYFVLNEAPH